MTAEITLAPCPTEREQFVAWAVQDCVRKITMQHPDHDGVVAALTQTAKQMWDDGHMVARAWQAARGITGAPNA